MKIDTEALRGANPIDEVVGRYVQLRRQGKQLVGRCPFHDERSPSFAVSPKKGVYYCYGCGASGDVIGFVMRHVGVDFARACELLGARRDELPRAEFRAPKPGPVMQDTGGWLPLLPAPACAPALHAGVECAPMNPQRGRPWRMVPSRADAYLDAHGRLLGYVMRVDMRDGVKMTPTVTWCIGPDGQAGWTVQHFPEPRPVMGLDELARRPDAPVLVVEGEKCRQVAQARLRGYVVVTWPGGGKAVGRVDWLPLAGRDVVLWPDADAAGIAAMLGYVDDQGQVHDGVAQHALLARARRVRVIDVRDPADLSRFMPGLPKGWDVADAFETERRTVAQVLAFVTPLVRDVVPQAVAQRVAA